MSYDQKITRTIIFIVEEEDKKKKWIHTFSMMSTLDPVWRLTPGYRPWRLTT